MYPEFVAVDTTPGSSAMSNLRRTYIPYPARLPPLTLELSKYVSTIGIYEKQSAFITFWSTHLENATDGRPTSSDYTNYARTIVETYPELKGGKNDFVRKSPIHQITEKPPITQKTLLPVSGRCKKSIKHTNSKSPILHEKANKET